MKADQIMKETNLLAKGYELIDGITVPVGTSNVDLGVEGKEPQNAEKLTIVVGNEKINMHPSDDFCSELQNGRSQRHARSTCSSRPFVRSRRQAQMAC